MNGLASVQETTLDVAWIRDSVMCLGTRRAERCYRAILVAEGPPEAFAPEAERAQGPLNAFASLSEWSTASTVRPALVSPNTEKRPSADRVKAAS